MVRKPKNAPINEAKHEAIILLKQEQKDLKKILQKIDKMQEFHEINDMTNQIFEVRLGNIEQKLETIKEKLEAING